MVWNPYLHGGFSLTKVHLPALFLGGNLLGRLIKQILRYSQCHTCWPAKESIGEFRRNARILYPGDTYIIRDNVSYSERDNDRTSLPEGGTCREYQDSISKVLALK